MDRDHCRLVKAPSQRFERVYTNVLASKARCTKLFQIAIRAAGV